jgi:hypothetical protein
MILNFLTVIQNNIILGPIARSGHRIFSDFDFIYVLGGYNYAFNNDKT